MLYDRFQNKTIRDIHSFGGYQHLLREERAINIWKTRAKQNKFMRPI